MNQIEFLTEKIGDDCRSIRRAVIVFYVELGLFLFVVTFALGVRVGQSLCS